MRCRHVRCLKNVVRKGGREGWIYYILFSDTSFIFKMTHTTVNILTFFGRRRPHKFLLYHVRDIVEKSQIKINMRCSREFTSKITKRTCGFVYMCVFRQGSERCGLSDKKNTIYIQGYTVYTCRVLPCDW